MINSKKTKAFDEGTGEFIPLVADSVKKEMRLIKRAKENGRKGIPRADLKEKDALATSIDVYLVDSVARAKDKYNNRIRALDDLTNKQSEAFSQKVTGIIEAAEHELNTKHKYHTGILTILKRDWADSEKELDNFRKEHDITGPAKYPAGLKATLMFLLVFVFMIIECVVSIYFIGSVHPQGFLGVTMYAAGINVITVGFSFFTGWFITRYTNHRSKLKRFFARLSTFAIFSGVSCAILAVAHYRAALEKSVSGEYIDQIFKTLFNTPFYFPSMESYILLIGGIIFSVIALIDGYYYDDPYPKYGAIYRDHRERTEAFVNQQRVALDDTRDLVDDYSEQAINEIAGSQTYQIAVEQRRDDKIILHERYTAWTSNIQLIGESLYADYREENLKHRKFRAMPVTFESHSYQSPKNMKIPKPSRITVNKNFTKDITATKKKCDADLKNLNNILRKYHLEYANLESMTGVEIYALLRKREDEHNKKKAVREAKNAKTA